MQLILTGSTGVMLALLLAQTLIPRSTDVLDVTALKRTAAARASSTKAGTSQSGGGSRIGGSKPDVPGLQVHLERISPARLVYDDEVFYEFSLRNVSNKSIELPWTIPEAVQNEETGDPPNWDKSANFGLMLTDGKDSLPIGASFIVGRRKSVGSIHTLEPGKTARILASGRLVAYTEGMRALLTDGRSSRFTAAVQFALYGGDGGISMSENTIGLEIAPKR